MNGDIAIPSTGYRQARRRQTSSRSCGEVHIVSRHLCPPGVSSIGSLAGDGKCCREKRRAGSSALQWPGLPESLHRVVPAGCDTPHEVELPETSCGLPVAFAELLAGLAGIEIGTAMHLRQTRRGATMVIGTLGAMNARVRRPAKSRTQSTSCSNRTLHDRDFGLRTLEEVYCCGQEMLLYQRFSSLGGTGSYPPWAQGWQRRILVNPIQPPRSAPKRSIAW